MMGNDNESHEQGNSTQGSKLKTLWNAIPPIVKLKIIGVLAGVVLFVLIIVVLISIIPSIFLDFSQAYSDSKDYQSEYEEYWGSFCEENSDNCTEEQIEEAKRLKESQEKFYNKLDSLFNSLNISSPQKLKLQRDIVLATVFYNYKIDDFTEGGAFTIDDDDEIDYSTDGKNVYEREQDTLKELIKQFKVNAAYCTYTVQNEDGTSDTVQEAMKDEDGSYFSYNHFQAIIYNINITVPDNLAKAKEECYAKNGNFAISESTETEASIEGYYNYLRESTFLDDRPINKSVFIDYARSHDLSDDHTTWPPEDRIAVREKIIQDIKDIVSLHTDEEKEETTYLAFSNDIGYWWPIGSTEVTNANGKQYARDDPHPFVVTSEGGGRIDPISGVKATHLGIDIAPKGAGSGEIPAIAAKSGTVVYPTDNADINREEKSCMNRFCTGEETYGNYVIIQHTDGTYTLYAHLYKGTITVRKNDSVEQGQVIGYIGSSGRSTGTHLHFEVRVGQNNGRSVVDPRKYIDEANPRPQSSLDPEFLSWFFANFEGSTGTDSTGTKYLVKDVGDGVKTAGPGINMNAQRRKFEQRGINIDDYPIGSYIDINIVESVKMQVLEELFSSIEATLSRGGLTLEREKIEALVVHAYNTGNIVGFVDAYKAYGDTQALFDNWFVADAKVNGVVWPGLVKRREKEWELFHNHVYV